MDFKIYIKRRIHIKATVGGFETIPCEPEYSFEAAPVAPAQVVPDLFVSKFNTPHP